MERIPSFRVSAATAFASMLLLTAMTAAAAPEPASTANRFLSNSIFFYSTNPAEMGDSFRSEQGTPLATLPKRAAVLSYDVHRTFQTIEGFGAALTDSSVMVINRLSPMVRTKLLHQLFDPRDGFNINVLRVPVGASDFSVENYSYLDLPAGQSDTDLVGFNASRAHDTIALLQEIREINPDLKVLLTPWSPPGWMKTSQSMINGSLKPEYFDAYARYLVKSIAAFEEQNIPVAYITVQNEPYFGNDGYASMYMSADDQIQFIRDHFGPYLRESGFDTEILAFDHNFSYRADADRIFDAAKEYLGGIAYHCYDGSVEDLKGSTAPIYQTECTSVTEDTDAKKVLHDWTNTEVIEGGLMGSKMALGWNIVLDETHGPFIGYCDVCRGMVDVNSKTEAVTVNPEMIAIAHAGKFVQPGAQRIETHDYKSKRFSYVAFLNPGGDVVMVIENKLSKAIAFAVPDQNQRYFRVRLPADGVATVLIPPPFLF